MRKTYIFTLIICLMFFLSSTHKGHAGENVEYNEDSQLFPFMNMAWHHEDFRMGYIDIEGNVVIEPKYSYAGVFVDGLACVSEGDGYYFIDKNEKNVFNKVFRYQEAFSCNRAVLEDENDNLLIIDTVGETISNAENLNDMVSNESYKDDMLLVINSEYKHGFLDLNGAVAIEPKYELANSFNEGYAVVCEEDKLIQIIDKQGNIVADTNYRFDIVNRSDIISDGLLSINEYVKLDGESQSVAGYIDINGNIAIPFDYEYGHPFSEGLAGVKKKDGLWGFIDKTGKYVAEPQFDMVGEFHEGVAAVYKSAPEKSGFEYFVGFINTKGELIIDYNYINYYTAGIGDLERVSKKNGLIEVMWESENGIWRGFITDNNDMMFKTLYQPY